MKIGVGRSTAKGGSGVTYPTNTGMSHIAKDRIEHLVSSVNRKHQEALATDGVSGWLFTKVRAGLPCTCQTRELVETPISLSEDSATVTQVSSSMGSVNAPHIRSFRISDYHETAGNSSIKITREGTDLKSIHERRMAKPDNFRDEDMVPVEQDNAIDDILAMADGFTDPDDDARQKQIMPRLYGGEKTRCGICFGSGFVGGYQLHGGQRIVLDASQTYETSLENCEVDATTSPSSFVIERTGNKWVEWQLAVPTYFEKVLAINVYDNVEPAVGRIIEAHTGNGVWTELSTSFLESLRGIATILHVRVRPVTSAPTFTNQLRFTHVELLYQLTATLKVDLPSLPKSVDFEQFDVLQTLSGVEFPASIPNLDREAVFVEDKYRQAWAVTEIEQKQTSGYQIFNNVVSLRLIQQYETKYLFNTVRGKVVELTYAGTLERKQGQGVIQDE